MVEEAGIMRYDLLLRNGRVLDGTGSPGFDADVAVQGGKIARIGKLEDAEADRVIDVGGHVIAPGFIDIHSHCDFILPLPDQAEFLRHFVGQGITTIVTGNCGYAPAPINPATAPLMQAYTAFIKPRDLEWHWRTFGEWLTYLETHGVYMNTVPLAAHGALRIAAMGFDARAPNDEELATMKAHLRECLESGAFGLSSGLIYAPGSNSTTDELAALSTELTPFDAIYTSHVRGSSETLLPAAEEVVAVARAGGIRVQHSHLEGFGKRFWPNVERVLALHEQTRRDGIDHGFDVIPYTAANTTFLAILPPWSLDGGIPKLLERLRDPATRKRIKRDIEQVIPQWPTWRPGGWPHNLVEATGWDNVWIMWVESEDNKSFEGKSLALLAEETGKDPFDVAADLILAEQGHVTALYLGVSGDLHEEWALRQILQHPNASIETDAFSLGRGKPHPALYGSFPKVLGQYVREEKLMTLEDAVRKMTSLSADRFHLTDRGRLREGFWADITVFDPDSVWDHTTYLEPDLRPSGIEYVIVNGAVIVDRGTVDTGTLAGKVVRAQGA
jgi:N-acyl-D-amino-acid deacylase